MGHVPLARFALRTFASSLFVSALALGSCSSAKTTTPGQLVVAIGTDMALPEQIDTIELQVSVGETTLLDYPMPTGTGSEAQPIPATLTLVAGPDPTVAATIRVIGWRDGVARTLRKVVTTVPTTGTAMLRMPVQWLCDGTTRAVRSADGGITYESECGADSTCQAGKCVPAAVKSDNLPNYRPENVFGGGDAPAPKGHSAGTCFDTIACMLAGAVEVPDDQCTVELPTGSTSVNVALRVASDGICDTTGTTCFVPLDGKSSEGWTVQDGRIALPPAVCTKLRNGLVTAVIVSTTCATKVDSTPPCGPWSSVRLSLDAALPPGTFDAAAAGVPSLLASVLPAGSKNAVCCPLMADSKSLYTCLCSGGAAHIVSIDPVSGKTTETGSFTAKTPRSRYATVLGGTGVYWVDRSAGAGNTSTCLVNQTSVTGAAMAAPLATVNGDVYDGADLLADGSNLYALADNVAGLAPGAAAVQLLRIDRTSGAVTPFDTGGVNPLYQFTQDAKTVYVGVDTDVAAGDAGTERISRVVRVPKVGGGGATTLTQQTLTVKDTTRGGFVGLTSDGSSLYALYETPSNNGIDVQVQKLGAAPSDVAKKLYGDTVASSVRLRLLGAVNGAVLVVRDATQTADGGPAGSESSVILIPANGSTPRVVASFRGDSPLFELQVPTFTSDVFWQNQSGSIYRLSAAALR